MDLSEYKQKSVYIVELENRYAVEEFLLGKHFTIRVSENCALEVVIPTVYRKDYFDDIGIPEMLPKYGLDIEKWGKIDNYVTINDVTTINASVSAVLVICYTKDGADGLYSGVIQNMARKVLHALHVFNPHVIRVNEDTVPNDLCEINLSAAIKENGKWLGEIRMSPMLMDDRAPRLTFTDIKRAIRSYDKTVSVPYEMLDNARVNLVNHDTRAAVLNCATAVEVALKKKLIDYLEGNNVPDKLNKFVLKKADGFAKVVEVLKKLSIPLKDLNDVKVHVMNVRNRVIHGGYSPTHNEVYKSLACTRGALTALDVKMFE